MFCAGMLDSTIESKCQVSGSFVGTHGGSCSDRYLRKVDPSLLLEDDSALAVVQRVLAALADGLLGTALLGPLLVGATSCGPVTISPLCGHRRHKLGKLMDRDVRAHLARDFA